MRKNASKCFASAVSTWCARPGFSKASALKKKDRREEYGEKRFVAIGLVEDECFVLVWAHRGNKRRLITAWKGGRDERQDYEDSHAGRNPRNG